MLKKIFLLLALLTAQALFASDYTQEDRERLIKLEARLDEGFKSIDKRFEQIDKRFDQIDKRFEQNDRRFDEIRGFMMWGFGILFGGMGLMIGFVLWDRRSVVTPVSKELAELKERELKLETLVKEFAKTNQEMGTIAKSMGYRL